MPLITLGVLGPVVARRAEAEPDLGRQLRHVLGLLLVRAGRPVTPDEFDLLLWGDDPPARAADIVHRHISNLRRLLEPDLPYRAQGSWVRRTANGYRLVGGPESADLLRFRELAEQPELEHRLAALRLWRGRCGAGLELPPELLPEFEAVDRERITLLCAVADDALASGEVAKVLPLVEPLAGEYGLDEALQTRLVLLLTAAGRQAEAMAAYHAVRTRLADELGVDPGLELRSAYDRVLHQDVGPAAARPPAPSRLPPRNRFFTGRAAELAQLSRIAEAVGPDASATVICALDGLPGVGKTSLVLHWAYEAAAAFPDGRLFVDLRGFDLVDQPLSSDQALVQLLSGLGVPAREMPDGTAALSELFRATVSDRRLLVVLDNARDEEQVRPLLPAAPGSLVLVTSRNRLTGLVVSDGAVPFSLTVPSWAESRTGMRDRLGADRVAGEEAALDEIIERCGRLPLAMAVASARALTNPGWALTEVAGELRESSFLDDAEPRSDVRNVFSWSYRMLAEGSARLFRLLAWHPGPDFGWVTAATLAGLSPNRIRPLLRELVRASLLTEIRPGRYAFHDLIKAYAAELSASTDTEAERTAAVDALLDHLMRVGDQANRVLKPAFRAGDAPSATGGEPFPDARAAMAWFAGELAVLESAVGVAGPRSWRLAELLIPYYQRRGLYQRWQAAAERALSQAVIAGDIEGQAVMHRMLAGADALAGRGQDVIEQDVERLRRASGHLRRSLELFESLSRTEALAEVYRNFGMVATELGEHEEAIAHFERSLALFEAAGDRNAVPYVLHGLGWVRAEVGDTGAALADYARAESLALETGALHMAAGSVAARADIAGRRGRVDEAMDLFARAEELFRRDENQEGAAWIEVHRGDLLARAGRRGEAAAHWGRARDHLTELGRTAAAEALTERLGEVTPRAARPG
ncbi:BTAD domain-containing putative transcriptional regulator [Actinoplanes sp. Pm04-4]|uniref:BTAD domain-containing putative transcriptional regulator n=1 Tax=Paractinoplanes pyxinae TaxID=2997416 RepID=A0ABT4BGI9_9ACTN|nr:BTAD domain-containing putative transcriptional regulator [Actinoplanes pyxinae]MCY1145657.1 BTAD domain-containing putative transcriptional regulator [Actinoplanes pyxinae]